METLTLARNAMATRFEIVLHGENPVSLRAAGEEALAEVDRLENQLSLYRPGSEIAQINARAAREPVQVSPELFALLQRAAQLSQATGGAFDITIAPLVRCWGFMGANGRMPSPEAVAAARKLVGMNLVELDSRKRTVRFAREGVMLDLGAIGKGYAVEQAAELLREAGVTSALLHGGTSTVYGLGHPPGQPAWVVAVDLAAEMAKQLSSSSQATDSQPVEPLQIPLRDESLSVSAASGRQFEYEGRRYGHVLDPRTGQPSEKACLAVVVLPSATETDALSTALLTSGPTGISAIEALRPGIKAWVAQAGNDPALVSTASVGKNASIAPKAR